MSIGTMVKKYAAQYQYQDYYRSYQEEIIKLLQQLKKNRETIAIWGAGLKGTAFLREIDRKNQYIDVVIDMNPNLKGASADKYRKITDYETALQQRVTTVIIMNVAHFADNFALLRKSGFTGRIIDLDELIENKVPAEAVIEDKPYAVKDWVNFDLKEVHASILLILDEIDRICKRHDITWFLSAGTALGAKRHQGFVPWDDDADIGMPRQDFEKFRRIVKEELGEEFYFQHMDVDNDFYRSYDQIGLLQSAFVVLEYSDLKMHHGIHVDVFPFDRVSGEESLREKHVKEVQKYKSQLYDMKYKQYYKNKNIWKQFIVNFNYYKNKFRSFKKLNAKMESALQKYDAEDTGYVADLLTHYKKIMYFKESDIFPTVYVPFEDRSYPVPNHNDVYLTMMYGDYMTPPPEGKRNQRHRLVMVSAKEAYEGDMKWRKS